MLYSNVENSEGCNSSITQKRTMTSLHYMNCHNLFIVLDGNVASEFSKVGSLLVDPYANKCFVVG